MLLYNIHIVLVVDIWNAYVRLQIDIIKIVATNLMWLLQV